MHNHWKNFHHHVSYGLELYKAYVTILGVNAWFSKRPNMSYFAFKKSVFAEN